jgi:SAM-dependent methyltransferase
MLPREAQVIDVGSGNGLIARTVMNTRSDVSIQGVDVMKRDVEYIPVTVYDGISLPFEDNSCDATLFVDVLHHTLTISQLLAEARRISKNLIVIKDHLCESRFDHRVLSFMDDVGNARFGVQIPQNYLSKSDWQQVFKEAQLEVVEWKEDLGLYPQPLDAIFGRRLHFLAALRVSKKDR